MEKADELACLDSKQPTVKPSTHWPGASMLMTITSVAVSNWPRQGQARYE